MSVPFMLKKPGVVREFAGALLRAVCEDMRQFEIKTLYLLTDHTNFYERYGWEFLCLVQGDGETEPARMYGRSTNSI